MRWPTALQLLGPAPAPTTVAVRPWWPRAALLLGCALAAGLALLLTDPAAAQAADPDLARLLRGMALLKVAILAPVLAVLWWRLGLPQALPGPLRAAYLLGAAVMAGAAALVWQLSHLALAAVAFHLGGLALLLAALGEGRRARRAAVLRARP